MNLDFIKDTYHKFTIYKIANSYYKDLNFYVLDILLWDCKILIFYLT